MGMCSASGLVEAFNVFQYHPKIFLSKGTEEIICCVCVLCVCVHAFICVMYTCKPVHACVCVCVTVSDGEHTTPELDFAILLLSNHQQPPVFQVLDPLLEVSVGGQAAMGTTDTLTHTGITHCSNFQVESLF